MTVNTLHPFLRGVLILVLALGIGTIIQPPVAQGQSDAGTGQQATISYALVVDTTGIDLESLCVGNTVRLPVVVRRRISVAGEPDGGVIQIRPVTFEAESGNRDVLLVEGDSSTPGSSSDTPFVSSVTLGAASPGSATLSVDATFETPQRIIDLHWSQLVYVFPCAYKVDVSTVWHTTMHNSGVVIISSIREMELRNRGVPGVFEQTGPIPGRMDWDTTGNRIRGCEVAHSNVPEFRVFMNAHIVEGELQLSLGFQEIAGSHVYFPCVRGTGERVQDCSSYPDSVCDPELGMDSFTPQDLPDVRVPIEGGTVRVTQGLIHSEGRAGATAIITVTLVPVR